jgi:TonB family protein
MTLAAIMTLLLAQATPAPPVPSHDYPAPIATPDAACNHPAEIVKSAYPIPDEMPEDGQPLYATVTVIVAANGKVEKATILKSSGNVSFDLASLRAARQSEYKPKMVNCEPVEGPIVFKTSLTPNQP